MATLTNRGYHDGPQLTARVLLAASMLASCYLDFFAYRGQGWTDTAALPLLLARLRGTADAPDQYRMGVLWLSHGLATHLHIAMTMSLAAMDGVCGLVAVLVLFRVLERSHIYAQASVVMQWFGAAAFLLLVEWFLGWLLWLQKPETLPAAMLVALMLWLWQPLTMSASQDEVYTRHPAAIALAVVALSLVLASFRADMACLLDLGVLLFLLAKPSAKLSLPRRYAISASLFSSLAAAGLQLWLMRVAYPQAGYGRVKMWQLWPNLKHASRWPPFLLFLLPLIWLAVQIAHKRYARDTVGLAFLAGATVYAALWVTIGKIDEVRIFLPLALALAPLTVQTAMLQVARHQSQPPPGAA